MRSKADKAWKLSKKQGAEAAAVTAEINALMAQLNALKLKGNSPQIQAEQAKIAQTIVQKTQAAQAAKPADTMKFVALGAVALKLVAFL